MCGRIMPTFPAQISYTNTSPRGPKVSWGCVRSPTDRVSARMYLRMRSKTFAREASANVRSNCLKSLKTREKVTFSPFFVNFCQLQIDLKMKPHVDVGIWISCELVCTSANVRSNARKLLKIGKNMTFSSFFVSFCATPF